MTVPGATYDVRDEAVSAYEPAPIPVPEDTDAFMDEVAEKVVTYLIEEPPDEDDHRWGVEQIIDDCMALTECLDCGTYLGSVASEKRCQR